MHGKKCIALLCVSGANQLSVIAKIVENRKRQAIVSLSLLENKINRIKL